MRILVRSPFAPSLRALLLTARFLPAILGSLSGSALAVPSEETRASAPERPSEMPLSVLPDPPKVDLRPARPAAMEAIDGILARVSGADDEARRRGIEELTEAKPDWTSGLARRIDTIVERADKEKMRALLESLRKKNARSDESDYLTFVVLEPNPSSQIWRDLAQILAVGKMLSAIGSADAMRELVRIYARYGDFLRIETQRNLERLGDRAVAGYLEATLHPASKISGWAKKQLELLRKDSPSAAVRTEDPTALALVLVALGRTRDPDGARVLISFAGAERSQIRLAARQGIALLGEVSAWQLRDAYQDTTGRTVPREWTWKRTARELFTELDRMRLAKVFERFELGRKKEAEGALEEMGKLYDEVLTESPLFEEREKMIPGYWALVSALETTSPDGATLALRRIERLSTDETERARAESRRHVLEARRLAAAHVLDQGLLDKAIALDPESSAAREALGASTLSVDGPESRYFLAALAVSLGLGFAGYVGLQAWRRRAEAGVRPVEEPRTPASPLPPTAEELTDPSPPTTPESGEAKPEESPPELPPTEPPEKLEDPSAPMEPESDEEPPEETDGSGRA